MEGINLAEKLWNLANLVTGFGVAQSLTVTHAMAKGDRRGSGRLRHPSGVDSQSWHRLLDSSILMICIPVQRLVGY
jgi:hypothetical protein